MKFRNDLGSKCQRMRRILPCKMFQILFRLSNQKIGICNGLAYIQPCSFTTVTLAQ